MWKLNFFNKKATETLKQPEQRLDHNHTWSLVAKTYARPRRELSAANVTPETSEKLMFGVTTLLSECETCGETKQEFLLGSDENMLDDILDKVDEFGNQTVNREENKYVVSRFIQPQMINGIPLR
jgi:hypothetical protein